MLRKLCVALVLCCVPLPAGSHTFAAERQEPPALSHDQNRDREEAAALSPQASFPAQPAPFDLQPTTRPAASPRTSRPIDGIRDNSFFIEEAYNQEAGVVQHIFTGRFGLDERGTDRTRIWDLSFTQEWPLFCQRHQLSYTIPYAFVDPAEREHGSGLGDVLLNYRYQLVNDAGLAIAPRISLVLPSGDDERGYGNGAVGYQFNLPVSLELGEHLYANLNAGFTHLPNASIRFSNGRWSDDADLCGFNLGGSVIWALTEDLNVLCEAVWYSNDELSERPSAGGRRLFLERDRSDDVVISPGVRWAWNLRDVQIVPGIALPIGLSRDAIDYGVFFYLSIEHPFLPAAPQ